MILTKDLLNDALKSVNLGVLAKLAKISTEWEGVVGSQLCRVCAPSYIWQKTLIIRVNDPAFLSPLDYSRVQILEKVQNLIGEKNTVLNISLRLEEKVINKGSKAPVAVREIDMSGMSEIGEAVAGAKDPELRSALEGLFRASLRHGRKLLVALCLLTVAACASGGYSAARQGDTAKGSSTAAPVQKAETEEEIARRVKSSEKAYYHFLRSQMYLHENRIKEALAELKDLLKDNPYDVEAHLEICRLSLITGKYDDAIDVALKGLAIDPDNVKLNSLLGGIYYNSKNFTRAETYLKKALTLDPSRQETRLNLAMNYMELKKYEEAEKLFLEVLKVEPQSVIAMLYLSRAYVEMHLYYRAEEFLTQFIKSFPDIPKAYETLGWVYVTQKKYDLAVDIFKQYLEKYPQDEEIRQRLANVYLLKKSYGDALDMFKELEKNEPGAVDLSFKMGVLYFQHNEFQHALEKFQLVRLKDPSNTAISYYIARIYEEMGMNPEAIKEWETFGQSATTPADKAEIQVRIAGIQEKMGKFDEAEATIQKAIGIKADDPELVFMLGVIRGKQEKYADAITSVREAIKMSPAKAEYHFYLGVMYEKTKEYTKCIEAMKQTLDINPSHADALNYIGYLYADQNIDLSQAFVYVRKALAIDPKNGYYLDSLAWAYFRQGKLDLALETIDQAIANTKEKDATLYEHLGDIQFARGKWDKAVEAFSVSLEVKKDPGVQKKLDSAKSAMRQPDSLNQPLNALTDLPEKAAK